MLDLGILFQNTHHQGGGEFYFQLCVWGGGGRPLVIKGYFLKISVQIPITNNILKKSEKEI